MNKLPFLTKGTSGGMDFRNKQTSNPIIPIVFMMIVMSVGFITLFLRLFQLTVVKGAYYRNLSENNRIREIIIEADRGTILDRKGMIIAKNVKHEEVINERVSSQRIYEYPEAFAHVVGYRQIADEHDISEDPCVYKLALGDKTGKKAIEKSYECVLRGKRGKKLVEVNAQGTIEETLSIVPPVSGSTIQLSLDALLQQKAYDLTKDVQGVVVALKPDTGEILALTSTPSFNPQYFEDGDTSLTAPYFSDEHKPLFNRATEGTYPPGSTFKIIMAAAALEEKVINASTEIEDTGTVRAGSQTFGNWYYLEYGRTEGGVDMIKALQRSNDIYFYRIGEKLGVSPIKQWSEKFGLGKELLLPIDEKPGTIPSEFWKEESLGERWYLGDTYNLSIGQGYLTTTPLQITLMTAVIANSGTYCSPSLLKNDQKDGVVNCRSVITDQAHVQIIQEGMKRACEPGGTGWPFFDFSIQNETQPESPKEPLPVACKTGTAESHHESGMPHAWFTAYAPIEKPEIVITVLIEAAGQGSDVAAPIAKELLTTYFQRQQ